MIPICAGRSRVSPVLKLIQSSGKSCGDGPRRMDEYCADGVA
jgi:hypothetical protein